MRPGVRQSQGFTVVEALIVALIIGTLAMMAIPLFISYTTKARIVRAVVDIGTIEKEIVMSYTRTGRYPDSLDDVGRARLRDPWGQPYRYWNLSSATGNGQPRQDRFLAPLNTDYDLYSAGPDCATTSMVNGLSGADDIVRANNGAYIGPAWEY